MGATLSIAASGMAANQFKSELIASNFANLSTAGHKRSKAMLEDQTFQEMLRSGSATSSLGDLVPSGLQRPGGVKVTSTYRINEQGTPDPTGNPLDIMIQGDGYLHVSKSDGTSAYTRAGNLNLDSTGTLVTSKGYKVMPGIQIPPSSEININPNGQVSVKLPGQTAETILGTIELARFNNEGGLTAIGENMLKETDSSGSPQLGTPGINGFGIILQKHLETSNVDPISEVVELIKTQRAYEMCSKSVQAEDDMMSTIVNMA